MPIYCWKLELLHKIKLVLISLLFDSFSAASCRLEVIHHNCLIKSLLLIINDAVQIETMNYEQSIWCVWVGGLMFETRRVGGGWLRPLAAALVATRFTNYRELKTFDIWPNTLTSHRRAFCYPNNSTIQKFYKKINDMHHNFYILNLLLLNNHIHMFLTRDFSKSEYWNEYE